MTSPIRADQVEIRPVDWLWRERIPRAMITTIGGRPEQGKGLIVTNIAAEVSRMKFKRADGTLRYGQVLYSAIEDSRELMTAPRLRAAGAIMKNVYLDRFLLPNHQLELERIIIEREIDLVVIDPFAGHLGRGVSRHSDNVREVLSPLSELIEQTDTAVIFVEHVLKRVAQNSHPLAAIGGSGSGLPAASRMAYIFGKDPADADRRVLACVKSNLRDHPKALVYEVDTVDLDEVSDVAYLLPQGEEEFDPMRLLIVDRGGRVGRPPDKKAAASEWLINYLYGALNNGLPSIQGFGPSAPGSVQAGRVFEDGKQFGISVKTLRKARVDLEIEVDPPGGGRNCYWGLPEELVDRMDQANGITRPKVTPTPPVDDESLEITDEDLANLLAGTDEEGDEKND